MVTPTSGQLQVPRRESFKAKSASLNELARRIIVRLDVRLKPMEPLPAKCVLDNGAKTPFHIPTTVVRYESIIPHVTGAEYTAHYLINVDYASESSIFSTYPIAEARFCL
jgi:hypothetical protein